MKRELTVNQISILNLVYPGGFVLSSLLGMLSTVYAKVEMFGKSKEKQLKKYIELGNRAPDACTFRNMIRSIDTKQLHTIFVEWMKNAVEHMTGVVAVDGKQARKTKGGKKASACSKRVCGGNPACTGKTGSRRELQ